MCDPGAVKWIETAFGECVITTTDKWSFIVGMLSNLCWIVSSAPQIYQNCKTKRVDGQSPFLFSLLETGNILALIGVIITDGLVTQIITSALYAFLDGIMFIQYLYYRFCYKRKPEDDAKSDNSSDDAPDANTADSSTEKYHTRENILNDASDSPSVSGLATAVLVAAAEAKPDWAEPYKKDQLVGSIFGWVGGCVYVGSRIPQVIKNFQNRKVSDLSPIYVCFAIFGNGTYCMSVFLKSIESNYLWKQTPFIFTALGPMTCDILFLIQMCVFGLGKDENSKDKYSDNSDERRLDEL